MGDRDGQTERQSGRELIVEKKLNMVQGVVSLYDNLLLQSFIRQNCTTNKRASNGTSQTKMYIFLILFDSGRAIQTLLLLFYTHLMPPLQFRVHTHLLSAMRINTEYFQQKKRTYQRHSNAEQHARVFIKQKKERKNQELDREREEKKRKFLSIAAQLE